MRRWGVQCLQRAVAIPPGSTCTPPTVCAALTGVVARRFVSSARIAKSTRPVPAQRRETQGRLTYDASKAGLEQVDKATVQATIDRLSRNSVFYQSEQKKAEARDARIAAVVARADTYKALSRSQKQPYVDTASAVEADLEARRDLSRLFLHVDMDMFYAAVEEREDPSLRERPFAVGSYAMLTTSNYVARQFGVRSGMPGFIAKKLCPTLRIVPTNFPLYEQEAAVIRAIAAKYDPDFVSVGLDEVTMDVTDYLRKTNAQRARTGKEPLTPAEVATAFRTEVFEQTGLTCSGGISTTAAFAKMASNVKKPNGQHEMPLHTREAVLATVETMPIRGMPGVGGYTEALLHALGVRTCGDMRKHKGMICFLFKAKTASFYLSVGLGTVRTHVDRAKAERAAAEVSASTVSRAQGTASGSQKKTSSSSSGAVVPLPKSISKSRTFTRRFKTAEEVLKALQSLTIHVHDSLLQHRARTSCVAVFTTSRSFEPASFSMTLEKPTNDYAELMSAVSQLATTTLKNVPEVRLLGVRVTKVERLSNQRVAASVLKHIGKAAHSSHRAVPKPPRVRASQPPAHGAKRKGTPKMRAVV